jgi:hypothetical protein
MSCHRIPVNANDCGDSALRCSLRGDLARQKKVQTDENDATSWNDTRFEDTIESIDRRCDQNRIHLGNVGLDVRSLRRESG